MFLYDAFGILFLILVATFLLFLPLATVGLLFWIWRKMRSMIVETRRNLTAAGL